MKLLVRPRLIYSTISVLFVLAACGPAATDSPKVTSAPASSVTPAAASATGNSVFQVIKPDGTTVDFALDDLKKLPLTSIMSEGSPEEGPSLLDVLKAANITDFTEVTLTGVDGSRTLTREEVTPEVVLDFNNRGSVKLASPTLPREARVRDIVKIEVK